MISIDEIVWGKYKHYEGPAFYNGVHFKMPSNPTENDRILAVITATEGGHWNAINMYDRCILTVGLIQWCEAGQYSVSDMLGYHVERNGEEGLAPLRDVMSASDVTFKKNNRNRWRFFFKDDRGEVDRKEEQRQLFLLNSNGKIGSFDAESKQHAKQWAASFANVYAKPDAIESQKDFTIPKLKKFALPFARSWIDKAPDSPEGKAFTSAYLSFAANNPLKSDKALQSAISSTTEKDFSINWLIHVLSCLTFKPGFTIYPGRYNKIRPVLEKFYGLDLPDFAEQLKDKNWMETKEVQQLLVDLGYDIGAFGPNGNGIDGQWGGKSQVALVDFQKKHELEADGWPDPITNEALVKARDVLQTIKDKNSGVIPEDLRSQTMALISLATNQSMREYFD